MNEQQKLMLNQRHCLLNEHAMHSALPASRAFVLSRPCRSVLMVLTASMIMATAVMPAAAQQTSPQTLAQPTQAPSPALASCQVSPQWLDQIPSADELLQGRELSLEDLLVRADHTQLDADRFAQFRGNVVLLQGRQRLLTGNAAFDNVTGELRAEGGLLFSDDYIAVRASDIQADSFSQSASIIDSEYLLIERSAHGVAGQIDIRTAEGERQVLLHDGTFTTCPGDRPAWQIAARNIEINENDSWGTAHHAQFRLFNVPVLYIPRFSFPLTDERKSGLLYPTIRSSARNGVELEVPYYFNLAENYDLTLTPRLMTDRGVMGMAEFRYLTESHAGTVEANYLHKDRRSNTDNSRSLWRVEQQSRLNERWSGYLDYAQVSDTAYINDFGSTFINRADPHLYRRGQLDYQAGLTRLQIQVEDFQMLGPYRAPYRTMPRFSAWHEQPLDLGFELKWFSEVTHFRNPLNGSDTATRVHAEPTLRYEVIRPAWDWQADLSYLVTHYDQFADEQRDASVTRAIPQVRWHGRIHLERPFTNSLGYQTLTPQLQYLYVPYRDQTNIGIYDTILMQDDYYSLFRPRRFTGLDRIADAHQVTIGATTSFFNDYADELLRLSLGQIIYLDESQTQLFDETSRITASNSELAAELDFRISERWFASSAVQYDTDLSIVRKSRAALEYRKDEGNLIQLNHRRVQGLVGTTEEVEQIGMVASWRLNRDWAFATHWYQDLRTNRTMDALFGLQYDSCCWSIQISAYRRVNRNYDLNFSDEPLPPAEFDNGVSLQFSLTGLSNAASSGIMNLLQQGIFGYRRPFYLSN